MANTPGLLMLGNHEKVLSALACSYIFGLNFGWLYLASKAERTNYVKSLTVSEVQGASWLFAIDLTCEEEQRSFLITIKACHRPWASHREKGSQASAPLPGANPCDAGSWKSPLPQKTVCNDPPCGENRSTICYFR